jgi:hypothetical protein
LIETQISVSKPLGSKVIALLRLSIAEKQGSANKNLKSHVNSNEIT